MKRLVAIAGCAFFLFLFVPAAHGQNEISFGVFSLFHPKELLVEPAGTQPISIHIGGRELLLNGEPGRRRLLVRANGGAITVNDATADRCTAEARDGASVRFRLSVPGRIDRVYQGKLTISANREILVPVIAIDREAAVASIVASEMPLDAPLEALKAQAVVTRSFLAAGPRHRDFNFCDTTHCQYLRSPDDVSAHVRQAVTATQGLVLSWQGRTIPALYSSRCGGRTSGLAEVGMSPRGGYPYYAVECRWCREHPVRWQTRLKPDATLPPVSNESRRLAFVRQWGWSALPGSTFTTKQDSAELIVEGHSIGHSIGMCQFGAIGLASAGADFRSILAHYFPNSQLAQPPW
jgi:stage II sporulation protein D